MRIISFNANGIRSATSKGFGAWFEYGVLQPLDGLGPGSLSRAHAFRAGLAIKF